MKKRILPLSLLLVTLMFGQANVIADNGGHYVPRVQGEATADSYMSELRANQHTGLIDPALMMKAAQSANAKEGNELYWLSMGPDNFGGQTTAVLYDNQKNEYGNPNGVVYIGSKGGGVYKTYNHGITWHQVGGMDLMVSCMAQDAYGTIYIGTGDGGYAADFNGLSQLSYDNSFIGSGIYKLENDVLTQIASTAPVALNEASEWSFVNDIACVNTEYGDYLIAATNAGLKYSTDEGLTWNMAKDIEGNELDGVACAIRLVGYDMIAAGVDGMVYIGSLDAMLCCSAETIQYNEAHEIVAIPQAEAMLDIAVAPSDEMVIYVACINANGVHSGIYVTYDKGITWSIAQPASASQFGHDVYSGFGLNNHGLAVNPNDPGIVYILGYNLWEMRKPASSNGYYQVFQRSNGTSMGLSSQVYLHVGLHCMVFDPDNSREFYIGTDGGIFKGQVGSDLIFFNCNRNYVTTRMFSVAYSNETARVLGAAQDHGSVLIKGDPNINHITTGNGVYPSSDGSFSDDYQPGECAMSMLNPNTIFVSYKNGGFQRSDKAGQDWISTNFLTNIASDGVLATTAFRFPYALVENYEDAENPSEVWYKNELYKPLNQIHPMSATGYPFTVNLPSTLEAGDSILVHDPISAKMYLGYKDNFYMTRGALNFTAEPKWYHLANKANQGFTGDPQCVAVTADGDIAYVGFMDGKFCRIENINVVNDSTPAISDSMFPVITTFFDLAMDGQCVTSIALNPRNEKEMVITLGNYGNENYILYTADATAAEPTFVQKQGNLPKMPVYTSLIEMQHGYVLIGTDRGIYMTENIAAGNVNWVAAGANMGVVPVMELKQQVLEHETQYVEKALMEGETITYITETYPGIGNTGIIYAATYGKGLYRCENFKKYSGASVNEMPAVAEVKVGMYPNPASSDAKITFNVNGDANVSYVVYDITGRVVMSKSLGNFAEGTHEAQINVSNLGSGSYILRLNEGANSSCVKFMVY